MAAEQRSLQGWVPAIGREVSLEQVIDLAFDYRGDVTVERMDGAAVVGYLFNRNGSAASPFVQLFDRETGEAVTLGYDEIANIRFTGRDPAAGQSYEAWKARRNASGPQS